jgi:hypothetical protein
MVLPFAHFAPGPRVPPQGVSTSKHCSRAALRDRYRFAAVAGRQLGVRSAPSPLTSVNTCLAAILTVVAAIRAMRLRRTTLVRSGSCDAARPGELNGQFPCPLRPLPRPLTANCLVSGPDPTSPARQALMFTR